MKLTIGNLAKRAEVTIETIRYYQRIGLLDEPGKPFTGYRHYPPNAITRIRFIKRAQQAGFTLKEIAQLLSLDDGHCADVRKIAEQKCQQIDAQIKDLTTLRNVLDSLVKGCQNDSSAEHCSLINALSTAKDGGSVAIGTEPMRPNNSDSKS
ncbi:MAG: MerR family DNA-binding protein [Methylobacter tundripaludum]|jgi:Predicted transcriptional regulators|nr:MerR family DNA-binding protein [Methylobacter tundripaludum]